MSAKSARRDPGMQMPETKSQYSPLVGGLDVESAQLKKTPGLLMAGLNYESATENGYERVGGYERFDGHPRPSDATYAVLQAATTFSGVSVGDTVTGFMSASTAKVIQVRSTNQLVVTRQTAAFTAGEDLQVGGVTKGVYAAPGDDFNSFDDNAFSALAAADYRADIAAVPGSGNIRGIAALGSVVYAWRDNAGATAMAIYKSTAGGWALVDLFYELSFTAGSGAAPAEAADITQGAVSATVKRVVLQSGTWAAGTAAGRFIIGAPTGGNFAAGAFTAGVAATCSGVQTAITLAAGGRLDTRNYNFTGSTATERIYGADGVNRGFEFDGTVLVPIATGMTTDKPTHVEVHRNHLFFSFRGSVQHSAPLQPYVWSVILGAAEIATGADVTGFSVVPGAADTSAMLIFSPSRTSILYGTDSSNWKLDTFSPNVGAQRWGSQSLGRPIVFDAQGVAVVAQSQAFGNFERTRVSDRVRRLLSGRTVQATVVNRAKLRMRIFFTSGDSLSITAIASREGERLAFTQFNYGVTVTCACDALIAGEHRTFFGGSDGMVYEADRGRSFDGSAIVSWAKLAFNFTKSPGLKKRFRWADIEVKPQSATTLKVQGEYSLGDIDVGLTDVYAKEIRGQGGSYDVDDWDEIFYDSPAQQMTRIRLDGTGTSLSLTFYTNAADEMPHELQSVTSFFTPRRLDRG